MRLYRVAFVSAGFASSAAALIVDHCTAPRLAIGCALIVDLVAKLRYEERELLSHFAAYAEYRRRTRYLIPFIY